MTSPWPSVISDIAREVMRRHHGEMLTPPMMTGLALEIYGALYEQLWFDELPDTQDYLGGRGVPFYCHEALKVAAGVAMSEGIGIDRAAALAQTLVGLFAIEWDDDTQPVAVAIATRQAKPTDGHAWCHPGSNHCKGERR